MNKWILSTLALSLVACVAEPEPSGDLDNTTSLAGAAEQTETPSVQSTETPDIEPLEELMQESLVREDFSPEPTLERTEQTLYLFDVKADVPRGVTATHEFWSVEYHMGSTSKVDIRVVGAAGDVVQDWMDAADMMDDEDPVAIEGVLVLDRPGLQVQVRTSDEVEFMRFNMSSDQFPHLHESDMNEPDAIVELYASKSGRWIPPASVLAVSNTQYVSYTTPPRSCSGRLLPGTREIGNFLKANFSGARSYGGYACRANTASPGQYSVHASGRALDVFVPLYGGAADNDKGDPIAHYLIMNAKKLGLEYLIWDRTSWGGSRAAPKHRRYTGPHPHHDHLHVEFSPASANRTGRTFPPVPGSCVPRTEVCDGKDNDCDGKVDEGVKNACGACGAVPTEVCDGVDNDCNGKVDDGEVCEIEWLNTRSATYAPSTNTDINGDGKADVCGRGGLGLWCHLANADGFSATPTKPTGMRDSDGWKKPKYNSTIRMGDVTGDGKAEVCARAAARVYCWRFTNNEWKRMDGPKLSNSGNWDRIRHYSTIRLMDFNGDGKQDICARASRGFVCWPSTGSGFGEGVNGPAWTNDDYGLAKYYGTIRTGDVNGDGKDDVCIRSADGMRCALSTGTGFDTPFKGPNWKDSNGWRGLKYWASIRLGDVNGDGKADLCARGSAGLYCYFSKGDSFGSRVDVAELSNESGWDKVRNHATLRMGDINGDGAQDLCIRANARVICYTWNGAAFDRVNGPEWSNDAGWDKAHYFDTIRMGDFNGDGKADLCARAAVGWACRSSKGTEFSASVVLDEFANDGGWTDPVYYTTLQFGGPQCKLVESCNGRDDDCNGTIDDNPEGEGEPCELPERLPCMKAELVCTDGGLVCTAVRDRDDPACDMVDPTIPDDDRKTGGTGDDRTGDDGTGDDGTGGDDPATMETASWSTPGNSATCSTGLSIPTVGLLMFALGFRRRR